MFDYYKPIKLNRSSSIGNGYIFHANPDDKGKQTMKTIQILINDTVSPQTALRILSAPDSGFQLDIAASDLHTKFRTGLEVTFAVAGLLLSAAQLAVAIYQIIQAEKAEEKSNIKITVILNDHDSVLFMDQSLDEIRNKLALFE